MRTDKRSVKSLVASGTLVVAASLLMAPLSAAQTLPAALVVVIVEKSGPVLGIIDPVAGKLVARVPTGEEPHIVAVSDDGRLAFVDNTDTDGLSIIDVAARKEIRRVNVGKGAQPADIHFVDGMVYFTASGWRAIGRYDPKLGTIEYFGLGQGGPDAITFSKDRKTIYAANPDSDNISILENIGGRDWTVTVVPVSKGQRPEDIEVSPDGRELWTINELGGGVSIVNLATKVSQNFNLQTKHANRMRFTPDGRRVLILDRDTGEMVVVDAASRKVATRVKFTGDKPGESMSVGNLMVMADGSRAYLTVNARGLPNSNIERPTGTNPGGRHYIAVIDLKTLAVTSRIDTLFGNGMACAGCR